MFTFQANVYNGCHDLLMLSMNLRNIATLNFKVSEYHCSINKSGDINLMQIIDLTEKSKTL